jgi:Fic family protein
MAINYQRLTNKKHQLDRLRPLDPDLVRNLEDWFQVELTYTSNALEGNTLTRRETALVVEKGLAIGGKSLREHLEVTNHIKALDWIKTLVGRPLSRFTQSDLLNLQGLILKVVDDASAGCYRNVPVRIAGSLVIMPNSHKVPDLMDAFMEWFNTPSSHHPVAFAGEAHYRLVTIHPFVDGNGRTARLLMNLILMVHGYPPAIIRKKDRLAYLSALEKAQLGGTRDDYDSLIAKASERSLDLYLKAINGDAPSSDLDQEGQLKIGELAKATGISIPTLRHWTSLALLDVAEITPSGYQLYAHGMIKRCRVILAFKEQRYTLEEIRIKLQDK